MEDDSTLMLKQCSLMKLKGGILKAFKLYILWLSLIGFNFQMFFTNIPSESKRFPRYSEKVLSFGML